MTAVEHEIVQVKTDQNGEKTAKLNIFPRQADMLNSDCDDLLYGGAAGGGKSIGVLLFALKRRLEYDRTEGIIFRRTYPELERSIIRESYKIYPHFGAKYNSAKHIWTFPNKSIQEFGHCERDVDVYNYHSAQYHDMCFDEASMFNEGQIKYLTSRCRSALPDVKPLIRLASNPGNVGHAFLYKRYIEPSQLHKIWYNQETGKKMTFIPAKIKDNPALEKADPNYMRRLKELPEKKYLALAEGRWDVFEGAYFPEFNPTPGFSVTKSPHIPDSYTQKFISMDWGYSEPASVHWHELMPSGRLFTYRELYVTRMSPKELAREIMEMTPKKEVIEYCVAPPEIWGKEIELEGGGEPIQGLMEEVFKNQIKMQKANNARIPGWLKMREYMKLAEDSRPWWQISPVCTNLIRTIPSAIHDDHRPEDIDKNCEDHCLDDCRYMIVSLANVPKESINPYESNYHKIFGIRSQPEKTYSDLPLPGGKGGY